MDLWTAALGIACGVTVMVAIKENCEPYGDKTWRVMLACLLLAAWAVGSGLEDGQPAPQAYRFAVVITFACAIPSAFMVARLAVAGRTSYWTIALTALLGVEILLHGLFWHFYSHVAMDRWAAWRLECLYRTIWTAGSFLQLLMLFIPGAWNVWVRSGRVRPSLHRLGHRVSASHR